MRLLAPRRLKAFPPVLGWVVAAVVALKALPFLVTRLAAAPDGRAWLPVGFIPKDLLAYVAFIRQVADQGRVAFANPFMTSPQQGRVVMVYLAILGGVRALTHGDPFWILELSRIPSLIFFFWALWRLVQDVFETPRVRLWACGLVAFSGGLEILGQTCAGFLRADLAFEARRSLWTLQGWNTFESAYNPMWMCAMGVMLLILRIGLRPGGPRGRRDVLWMGIGLFVLYWVHPYSALATVVILAGALLAGWLAGRSASPPAALRMTAGVVLGIGGALPIVLWQVRDAAYAQSTGGVLGGEAQPIFSYPLTLGAVGFFAMRGFLALEGSGWRTALLAWVCSVAWLHSSTLVNGYHFAPYLHVPLCVLAAPAVVRAFDGARASAFPQVKRLGLALALFSSSAVVTIQSLLDLKDSLVPAEVTALAERLGHEPAGNVFCSAGMGNVLPAYGPHRVYVGHWFLTPAFDEHREAYRRIVESPGHEEELSKILAEQRIRYLVVPRAQREHLASALAGLEEKEEPFGKFELVWLKKPESSPIRSEPLAALL
jgi:hypothetical protein